jgi:hypothetical protein
MSSLNDFILEPEPLGSGGQGCAYHAVRIQDRISVVLKKIYVGTILQDPRQAQQAKEEVSHAF